MRRGRLRKQDGKADRKLVFLVFLLTILGLIAVADASAPQALNIFSDKPYFFKQQAVWAAFGLFLFIVISKIHYSLWEKVATPLFFVSLAFLIVVLLPGIGSKFLGARRWIIAGPISFQPSEIVKLALAVYLAKVGSRNKSVVSYFLPLGIVSGLIMLEPDLGTTLVVAAQSMAQIFVSGLNIFVFAVAGLLGGLASVILIWISDYRRERLLTFFEQTTDPLGRSYHIRQVLLALGSGGIFGVGLGESRQKYLFLPEAATDSIFAVIAEEVGFIGGTILILVFAYLIFLGLGIVRGAPDKFSQILATGIIGWIGFQVFLNIGSMVGLVPLTGVPLPFFSYGGSALVMVLVAMGILVSISKHVRTQK